MKHDHVIKGSHIKGMVYEHYQLEDEHYEILKDTISHFNYTGICCYNYKMVEGKMKIFEINPRICNSVVIDAQDFTQFMFIYRTMAYVSYVENRQPLIDA